MPEAAARPARNRGRLVTILIGGDPAAGPRIAEEFEFVIPTVRGRCDGRARALLSGIRVFRPRVPSPCECHELDASPAYFCSFVAS